MVTFCEIKHWINNFKIISVLYFTRKHIWNWNKIISAAEWVMKLFQNYFSGHVEKYSWAAMLMWNIIISYIKTALRKRDFIFPVVHRWKPPFWAGDTKHRSGILLGGVRLYRLDHTESRSQRRGGTAIYIMNINYYYYSWCLCERPGRRWHRRTVSNQLDTAGHLLAAVTQTKAPCDIVADVPPMTLLNHLTTPTISNGFLLFS